MNNKYDWRYENSITSGKKIELDGDYSQWRTNNILSNHKDTILYANEMNCHYGVTDQMHYDYLFNSIRKTKRWSKAETKEEKKADASSSGVSSTTTAQGASTETKPAAPTARQELQAKREAAAKAEAVEKGCKFKAILGSKMC